MQCCIITLLGYYFIKKITVAVKLNKMYNIALGIDI